MSCATAVAKRPNGTSAASTTCHSWLMSVGRAVNVFIADLPAYWRLNVNSGIDTEDMR
jgi:hypothetical protein